MNSDAREVRVEELNPLLNGLTTDQMRSMLAFLSGYSAAGWIAAHKSECVRKAYDRQGQPIDPRALTS